MSTQIESIEMPPGTSDDDLHIRQETDSWEAASDEDYLKLERNLSVEY